MKTLFLRGLALTAATVASLSLLNSVASIADADRAALAYAQQVRATLLAAAPEAQRR